MEYVEDHEMPLRSYTWGHPEARLTDAQRETLVNWAQEVRAGLGGSDASSDEGDEDREENDTDEDARG